MVLHCDCIIIPSSDASRYIFVSDIVRRISPTHKVYSGFEKRGPDENCLNLQNDVACLESCEERFHREDQELILDLSLPLFEEPPMTVDMSGAICDFYSSIQISPPKQLYSVASRLNCTFKDLNLNRQRNNISISSTKRTELLDCGQFSDQDDQDNHTEKPQLYDWPSIGHEPDADGHSDVDRDSETVSKDWQASQSHNSAGRQPTVQKAILWQLSVILVTLLVNLFPLNH